MSKPKLTEASMYRSEQGMVLYETLFQNEQPFSGVAENNDDSYYGTEEELYRGILSKLSEEYLQERYSLCLEIRDGDRVVHAFPKVACSELILKQLQLNRSFGDNPLGRA